jgi:hypothetical protein
VGNLGQPEFLPQFGEVGEELDNAPIVGLEECLESEDRKQLVLCEVLATAC